VDDDRDVRAADDDHVRAHGDAVLRRQSKQGFDRVSHSRAACATERTQRGGGR
jgi:hypothetical protein